MKSTIADRGSARLTPERRLALRRLVAEIGRERAARSLGIGVLLVERAQDPYELLHVDAVRRLEAALERLGPRR